MHKPKQTYTGVVIECRPNTQFLVKFDDVRRGTDFVGSETVNCYLGGKMKVNKIRVDLNDKVEVDNIPEDWSNGRIIRRK